MLLLCYFSVNKRESSESVQFNKNIMWATDVILGFLVATLKRVKRNMWK